MSSEELVSMVVEDFQGNSRMLGQGKHKALFLLKKENQQKRLEWGILN
jgi:hypothetical protein